MADADRPAAGEPLAPDAPIPPSPAPPSPRPPRPRRPLVSARPPPRALLPPSGQASPGIGITQWSGLGALGLLLVHLFFSRPEFTLPVRFLIAIPALLFFLEIHRYLAQDRRRELPFNVLGLFYFYITFSFPALFDIRFVDLSGPVSFTDQARLSGGMAVGFGCLCMYGAIRAGETLGINLRPGMIGLSPPGEVPPAFARALLWYGALTGFVAVIYVSAPSLIPGSLAMILTVTTCFELALGMAMAKSELLTGPWSRYFSIGLLAAGWAGGLIRGVLEPVFRLGMPYVAGQWSFFRKISFRLLAAGAAIYLIFQPIKHDFRSQVWGRTQVGYGERVEAWGFALDTFFSREDKGEQVQDSAIARVAELDSVMHAFDALPGRVRPLDGSGWLPILTAPIPRFIWRDKPTTQEGAEQRYAVTFGRQTEEGARTTAIMLPLLVDGYWNFGWPGIAFACGMIGIWVGFCQKVWSADHWALQAMGMAHFSRLTVQAHLGSVYSGLFQSMTGLLLACWAVYWLAGLLSQTPAVAARRLVTPAIMGGRAPGMSRRSSAR